MITVIAILSILAGSLMPMLGRQVDSAKAIRVKAKLETIKEALEFYHYEMKAFPSSLGSDGTFNNLFLNDGVTDTKAEALVDDFSLTPGTHFQFYKDATSNPEKIWVWSVGPDRADGSTAGSPTTMGGDDIWVRACEEVPGRRRTELMLNIITYAYARKLMTAGARPTTLSWGAAGTTSATPAARPAIDLGIEFLTDGFGGTWVHYRSSAYLQGCIVSYGPNQIVNTGTSVSSIGTGDDIRQ